MISLKKRSNRGFTIVELLIVIVIIGILAALVIVTYSGVQQKARDTKRKTDVNALQGQLEAYWATYAKYPTLAEMNTPSFITANMKGLDPSALQDPKGSSQQLCATNSATCYGYVTTPTGCDNAAPPSGVDCSNYVLTASLESGGTFSKQSNN